MRTAKWCVWLAEIIFFIIRPKSSSAEKPSASPRRCPPVASRIAIAACSEGLGYHGLFPFLNAPRFHLLRKAYRLLSVKGPRSVGRSIRDHFRRKDPELASRPIWLYQLGK